MNKKRSVSIILIILSIILIGIVGYFTLIKNLTPPTTTNQISPKSIPTKETFPTTTPTLEKVRIYDLKFDFYYIGIEDLRFGLSKDGKYGYIASQNIKDNKYYIQVNNQTYGPYDYDYYAGYPKFSNDSSKYGWTFRKNDKYYIQINNQTYGPYDYVSDYSFQFSNDGSKYVWVFGKDCEYEGVCKQRYIQINNKTYGPYDYVGYLRFSNDGSKYGWVFGKGCKYYEGIGYKCKKYYIQINNKTYGPYDYVYSLEFFNDSSKYVWTFRKNDEYYIQINNQTYGPYDYVSDYSFQFSNDGSKYGWIFGKDCKYEEWNSNYKKCKKYYIQINNKTYGPYDNVFYPYIKFSNDGSKYGWIFGKDCKYEEWNSNYKKYYKKCKKYYIQINNKTYGPYDYVFDYSFRLSNDGSKYVWMFGKGCKDDYKCKKYYIQINNKTYGPYDYVFDYSFRLSNDGSKYGWMFGKDCKYKNEHQIGLYPICNRYYIEINNKTYGPYDYVFDYSFQFSNDGSKYVWMFEKDCEYEVCKQLYIQINNQTYGPYDKVYNFEFSNDISKYGWIFEKDNKYYIQINNQTYGPYDLSNFTFTNDNKAYIVYIKDKKMVIEQID